MLSRRRYSHTFGLGNNDKQLLSRLVRLALFMSLLYLDMVCALEEGELVVWRG